MIVHVRIHIPTYVHPQGCTPQISLRVAADDSGICDSGMTRSPFVVWGPVVEWQNSAAKWGATPQAWAGYKALPPLQLALNESLPLHEPPWPQAPPKTS